MSSADIDTEFATHLRGLIDRAVYREDAAPQGSREPYATYARLSLTGHRVLGGVTSLAETIYRVTLYSRSTEALLGMQDAMWEGLDGWRGDMEGVPVYLCRVMNIGTATVRPTDGGEGEVHELDLDVAFHFKRAAIPR